MTRHICYVSGTRADFSPMAATLAAIDRSSALSLSVAVTGMHLSPQHGLTVREIEAQGFAIAGRIAVEEGEATGALMARNIGLMLQGLTACFEAARPDLVLVMGDRGEMLAGALAAIHLNIPVVHVHGGERSGTVDEPIRHAISKLAHVHFTATDESRERLVRMGESQQNIHVTGAPGLDGLDTMQRKPRDQVCADHGLDPLRPLALMVYHPVLQEAGASGEQAELILGALEAAGCQVLALMPNSDAGSAPVRDALASAHAAGRIALATHLARADYVSALAACDVMIGNSSSGIIEAATFGTPVINVGARQNMRQRNANVCDVDGSLAAISAALHDALAKGRLDPVNVYGDGRTAERIANLLATLPIDDAILRKINAY